MTYSFSCMQYWQTCLNFKKAKNMKTIKNKFSKLLLVLVAFTTVFVIQNCKKVEKVTQEKKSKEAIEQKFFEGTQNANETTKRIASKFREFKDKEDNYIVAYVEKYGYPRWDKIQINNPSSSNRSTNQEPTDALIPVVEEEATNVKACIKAEITNAVTNIDTYELNYYQTLPFGNDTYKINIAERWVIEFMIQTKLVFGTSAFKITDNRLFNNLPINNGGVQKNVIINPKQNANDPTGRYFCIEVTELIATGTANCGTPSYCQNNFGAVGCDALTSGGCPSGSCTVNYTTSTTTNCTYLGQQTGGGNGAPNFGNGSGFTGYTGGGFNGTGGTLPWTNGYYPIVTQAANLLGLNQDDKNWLNSQNLNLSNDIVHFVTEADNTDPLEDDIHIINQEARQSGRALVRTVQNNAINIYDENSYLAIKQFAPIINGSNAQQADIFWSNFSLHCAISKENNSNYSNYKHWMYAFYNVYWCNLNLSFTGQGIANLTNGYFQTLNDLGLNATLVNQNQVTPTNPADPKEFKRKTLTNPIGKKIDIVWYKDNVTNKIIFGDRGQLRVILGLVKGDSKVAHHIIPVAICENSNTGDAYKVIQLLGAKGDFHMNQIENGIPNNNSGSHSTYNNNVNSKLSQYYNTYIASGSTAAAYNTLKNSVFALMLQIKNLLVNPATKPNDITF